MICPSFESAKELSDHVTIPGACLQIISLNRNFSCLPCLFWLLIFWVGGRGGRCNLCIYMFVYPSCKNADLLN